MLVGLEYGRFQLLFDCERDKDIKVHQEAMRTP
jgi:hypothetical protein